MIEIMSREACVQCTASKRTLDNLHASYVSIDLEAAPDARALARKLGYLQAPVVLVRDREGAIVDHWSGFRPEKLREYAA